MEDSLALVALSRGQFAIISADDHEIVAKHNWWAVPRCDESTLFYATAKIGGKTVYMHRLIMEAQAGKHVDHANGDGLDNRRSNLRICTPSQNNANTPRRKVGKSGARGVYRHGQKWRVTVLRNKYIGSFDTLEAAITARDAEAKRLFGDFAVLNEVAA